MRLMFGLFTQEVPRCKDSFVRDTSQWAHSHQSHAKEPPLQTVLGQVHCHLTLSSLLAALAISCGSQRVAGSEALLIKTQTVAVVNSKAPSTLRTLKKSNILEDEGLTTGKCDKQTRLITESA